MLVPNTPRRGEETNIYETETTTPEQVIAKLREADAMLGGGATIAQVVQQLGVTEQTYYRWRNQYGGMKSSDAKLLKEPQKENACLKQAIADLTLDKQILKEGIKFLGKQQAQRGKREMVRHVLLHVPTVFQRRACVVFDQHRSTQRYQCLQSSNEEHRLVKRMHDLVRVNPRYGYRRIWGLLRLDSLRINIRRIYRLWKQEGFKVPRRQHKKRNLESSMNWVTRKRATHKDHVWCWDFIHDSDEHNRPLK